MLENDNIEIIEETEDVEIQETVQVIEVDDVELFTVETDEAFAALGDSNEQLRHPLLHNRDLPDQHPITAITGLRDELDDIQALKTVYSNGRNSADYYLWQDENSLQEVRLGYFVSLCEDTNRVQICTDGNIFGVVVDNAAFVGGQTDIERDYKYALVTDSGVVAVRCELDVNAGDYITSNNYGYAKKSKDGYGYRVAAIENIKGVIHAIIVFKITMEKVHELANDIINLEARMGNVESNIVSAMNSATEAHNAAKKAYEIANDLDVSSGGLSSKINQALDNSEDALNMASSYAAQIEEAKKVSAEAKTIANNAVVSAEGIRSEAVMTANEAFAVATKASESANLAKSEAQEALNTADQTKTEIKNVKDDMSEAIQAIDGEIEPLSEWTSEDGTQSGVTGFVAQVNEDSATLASIVEWKGDSGESVAAFVQEATEENATIKAIASYNGTSGNENAGAAGLIAQVDANKSDIALISSYEYKDAEGNIISEGISGLTSQVSKDASELALVADYEYKDAEGNTTTGLAALTSQVDANGAQIDELTKYDGVLNTSIAQVKQQADENGASITGLVMNIDKYSVGEYSQSYELTLSQAIDILQDGVIYIPTQNHIENLVNDIGVLYDDIIFTWDEENANENRVYYVLETKTYYYKQTFGMLLDEWMTAENISNIGYGISELPQRIIYNLGNFYKWNGKGWDSYSNQVSFDKEKPSLDGTYTYWYTENGVEDTENYKADTLYKLEIETDEEGNEVKEWVQVAILQGNLASRSIGALRLTTNQFSVDLTNVKGDVASISATVDEQGSSIEGLTTWQTDAKTSIAQVQQQADANGASITSLIASIDKYSVGEYSQAYGLTVKQAINILQEGMVYIPTENHYETYINDIGVDYPYIISAWSDEGKDTSKVYYVTITKNYYYNNGEWVATQDKSDVTTDDSLEYERGFTPTASYIWDGEKWVEQPNTVYITNTAPTPDATHIYWYTKDSVVNNNDENYQADTLYRWQTDVNEAGEWVPIAMIEGNLASRATNIFRRTTNEFALELTNVKTDVVSIRGEMTDQENSISLLVTGTGEDKKINAASIVAAVNGDSAVAINADKIVMTGTTTFLSDFFTEQSDVTVIDGGTIATGSITASQIAAGTITADKLAADAISANTINATTGTIGSWKIGSYNIHSSLKDEDETTSNQSSFYLSSAFDIDSDYWIYANDKNGNTVFKVGRDGVLEAQGAKFDTDIYIGDRSVSEWITKAGYLNVSDGNLGGFEITGSDIHTGDHNTVSDKSYSGVYIGNNGISIYNENNGRYLMADLNSGTFDFSGYIYADGGNIGGWDIQTYGLDYKCLLSSGKMGWFFLKPSLTTYAYGCTDGVSRYLAMGLGTTNSIAFGVTLDGALYAGNATIKGHIEASSGSFTGTVYASDGTFTGTVTAKSGYIGTSTNGFVINSYGFKNNRAAFTGNTGSSKNGVYVTTYGNAEASYGGISLGAYNSSTGLWYDQYIYNGSHIITGMISSGTYGRVMMSANGVYFYQSTNSSLTSFSISGFTPASIQSTTNGARLVGSWFESDGSTAITSDENKKNTITPIDEKYDALFDKLSSVTYKYNEGTSDRLHTGFIAQQVKSAMDETNIDSQEFAGLVIDTNPNNTQDWYLRYEEFISLNTWQIQKLKARVAELEAKIELLTKEG